MRRTRFNNFRFSSTVCAIFRLYNNTPPGIRLVLGRPRLLQAEILMSNRLTTLTLLVCLSAHFARAQDSVPVAVDLERWNLFYQATSIGQYHGSFPALYSGPLSLSDKSERDVSLTTTLFFGLRLTDNTQLYFD